MAGPIRISVLTDARSAVAGLNETGRAADGLGTKLGGAARAAVKYAAAGAALAAGAAVIGLAKLAAGAAEDQAAATALAGALKKSAGATDAQVAATEAYISKVGVATGITDDELRPALTKFAQATGSVQKAQEATNLAMDVAAGSNTNLTSVTKTLAKAYTTGSVTALSKFGVAAKNADGSTKTLAQATEELGKKFGGSAADKAETLQGKIARLKLIVSEAGETIGYKVIPVITRFADFLVNKVVPAVVDIGGKTRYVLVPVFETIASVVTGKVVPAIKSVIDFFVKYQDIIVPIAAGVGAMVLAFTAYSVVMGIVSSVTAAYTAVQAALNLVMTANPIGVVILLLVGVAAALAVAYAKSETFRDIVNAAFNVVKTVVAGVLSFFTDTVPAAFDTIVDAGKSVVTWVKNNWPLLLAIITGPIGLAVLFITKNWDTIKTKTTEVYSSIKNTVTEKFGDIVSFIGGIPGKILALGSKFKDAGAGVMDKIVEGIKSAASFIDSIATTIGNAVKGVVNGVIDKVNSSLEFSIKVGPKSFTINPPDIPHLARGGVTTGPTLAVVGDNPGGREAIIPLDRYGALGGTTINVRVEVAPTADPVSVGREIQSVLDAYRRTGGRSFAS